MKKLIIISVMLLNVLFLLSCRPDVTEGLVFPLNTTDELEMINAEASVVEFKGKTGLRVTGVTGPHETLVIIPNVEFVNGTIEVEVSGEPAEGSPETSRGFVGLAFRVNELTDHFQYECFYIRPTNGRADNQVQRNHAMQYTSHPDYPWYRLRKESPKKYEAYADMQPGEWIKMKIEVRGETAKFYLHGNDQPNLIVNDLKLGDGEGGIALWLHSTTLAHYRNLIVHHED